MNHEEKRNTEYYFGLPFAMEIASGNIISMTGDFQRKLQCRVLEKYDVLEMELADFICVFGNEYYGNYCIDGDMVFGGIYIDLDTRSKLTVLSDTFGDNLPKVLGFDMEKRKFTFSGINQGESDAGWAVSDWLKELGFDMKEDKCCGPDGQLIGGFRYVDEVDDEG